MPQLSNKAKLLIVGAVLIVLIVIILALFGREQKPTEGSTNNSDVVVLDEQADDKKSETSITPWDVNKETSEKGDVISVSIQKYSNAPVQVWLKKVSPKLVVTCSENKTTTSLEIGTSFALSQERPDKTSLDIGMNGKKKKTQKWQKHGKGKIAIAPEAINFLRSIKKAKTLEVGFTPFNAEAVVAEFDVAGIETQLEEISKACGWKL